VQRESAQAHPGTHSVGARFPLVDRVPLVWQSVVALGKGEVMTEKEARRRLADCDRRLRIQVYKVGWNILDVKFWTRAFPCENEETDERFRQTVSASGTRLRSVLDRLVRKAESVA
jgi:hypothetical protein